MIYEAQLLAMFVGASLRLCWRKKVPVPAQNVRDLVRTLRENLTDKYAGPFAGTVTVVCLKVCENNHRCMQGDIS